ncbi:MAG TPA: hypothetical protein VEU97_18195 [Ktedonobacteraceae bacterium]|nr:hypothetical protein [Ktedonobacteraceae bacterium]
MRSHTDRSMCIQRVANRERRMLWDRKPILRGKLWVNVATRVVGNQGMIFKP